MTSLNFLFRKYEFTINEINVVRFSHNANLWLQKTSTAWVTVMGEKCLENYPSVQSQTSLEFKTVLMSVTCKNISLCCLADRADRLQWSHCCIPAFLHFLQLSHTIPHTVTATKEIQCNAGFTHYTIVHSAGDSDSGAQWAMHNKTKDHPHTHTIFHYTTKLCV